MMEVLYKTFEDPLRLELGGNLEHPTLAYSTLGILNEAKDNVVLVCHALTANSQVDDWWSRLVGERKVFDPTQDFIICINNLGSPYGSSSPKSEDKNGERYGMNFPAYTLRDTAELHIRLLTHLGINQLKLIIGGSCGGNIAQEMAILLGEKVEELILLCCSSYETPWVISIHESQRMAMKVDPSLFSTGPESGIEGLRGARAFALPFYRSHAAFKIRQTEDDLNKTGDFKASSYVQYQGDKFADRYDAHCYYKQITALDTHNIGRNRGSISSALNMIKSRTLVIGFSSDLLIPVVEQQSLAKHIPNGSYTEIKTPFGHDAFLIETDLIQEQVDLWKNSK